MARQEPKSNQTNRLLDLRGKDVRRSHRALKEVYNELWLPAKSFMRSLGLPENDTEDVFQEAMVLFYTKVRNKDFELSSSIKTYVFAILKNMLRAQKRKNKKAQNTEVPTELDSGEDIEGQIIQNEQRKIIMQTIMALGDKCYKVLRLFYFEQLSMKEIAEELGYANEQVAKNRKNLCMKKLKQTINKNQLKD